MISHKNHGNISMELNDMVQKLDSIEGCTDPLAENFDSLATYDDGSCTGSIVIV